VAEELVSLNEFKQLCNVQCVPRDHQHERLDNLLLRLPGISFQLDLQTFVKPEGPPRPAGPTKSAAIILSPTW